MRLRSASWAVSSRPARLDLRVAAPQGILAGAQRFLGLLALDNLGFERTLLLLRLLTRQA